MKNLIKIQLVTIVLAGMSAQPLRAEDPWARGVPPASAELATKLLSWEQGKRAELARERRLMEQSIADKRAQVLALLKQHLRQQRAGTDAAYALEALVRGIEDSNPSEDLILVPSPKLGPSDGVSREELFTEVVKSITVVAHGGNHHSKARENGWLVFSHEGRSEKIEGLGLHLLFIGPEGLIAQHVRPGFQVEENDLDRYAEELEAELEKAPEESIVVVAATEFGGAYDERLRDLVRPIGGKARALEFGGQSYICIGYPGLERGNAIEVFGGKSMTEFATYGDKKKVEE